MLEPMNAKPWAIYIRVANDEHVENKYSLAAQESACRAMCAARGIQVGEVFSDAKQSAASLARSEVQRLMALVREGRFAGVVIWRLDRLTRNLSDLGSLVTQFDETKTALVSIIEQIATDTPAGRLMMSMLRSVAEWERSTILERIRLGMSG